MHALLCRVFYYWLWPSSRCRVGRPAFPPFPVRDLTQLAALAEGPHWLLKHPDSLKGVLTQAWQQTCMPNAHTV